MSAEEDVQALRAATREAHEAIRGLREVLRDVALERRAVQQLLDGIEGRVKRSVGEEIERQVETQVEALTGQTRKAMNMAVEKVFGEFDRIQAILTGRERPDGSSLEELTRRHVARLQATAKT